MNTNNALASKNNEVAILFAKFLHELWNKKDGHSNCFSPSTLKRSIGNHNSMFKGFQQHDSNELIQFLLDQLHEDLNRIEKKPYIEMPTDKELIDANMSDNDLATFYNEAHLKRNESLIQDLFFGQFKSTVICSECHTSSKKYDPFMTLPVPIPQTSFDLMFYFVPYLPNEKIF